MSKIAKKKKSSKSAKGAKKREEVSKKEANKKTKKVIKNAAYSVGGVVVWEIGKAAVKALKDKFSKS